MFIKKYTVELLVLTIILSLLLVNVFWLHLDTRPPHWDFARHLTNSLYYLDSLKSYDIRSLILDYSYYPPFSYYITSLVFLIFGIHEDIAVLSLTPFLLILIFFTFKLGKLLYDRKTGLLAVISVIGLPFLMSVTREYLLDFPLTAMIVMNTYFFVKSDFLKDKKYLILFAVGSGLALLTKWTYMNFFLGMVILVIIDLFRRKQLGRLRDIFFTVVLISCIAGPWYLSNISNLRYSFFENIQIAKREGDSPINSSSSFFYYLKSLYMDHLRFPLTVLFVIGMIHLVFNRKKNKKLSLILFLSVFYLLTVTFYLNKDPRFIMLVTPFLAIITSFWILKINQRWLRIVLISFVMVLSIFNYTTSAFGLKQLPEILEYKIFTVPIVIYKQWGHTLTPARRENWYVDKIVRRIAKDIDTSENKINGLNIELVLQNDKMFFNMFNFRYYQGLYLPTGIYINTQIIKNNDCENIIRAASRYLIINSDLVSILKSCSKLKSEYKNLEEYLLPDNSKVLLLKKLVPI